MWRDISTAPKDRFIDLWVVDEVSELQTRFADCIWKDEQWVQPQLEGDYEVEPYPFIKATHWAELPEPPNA